MSLMQKHIGLLGFPVVDRVTGFKGVVTSVTFDLYGCVQSLVHPGADASGKMQEQCWFDVSRLTKTATEPVMAPPDFENGRQAEGLQGAAEKPRMSAA